MTNISGMQATDGVPTYLGRGDPAGRFSDYYPAWVDNMAPDITLDGSLLDGAVQGADAIRAVIGGVRQLYDRQDFNFAGFGDVLLPPAARAVRRHPLRRTLPR